MEERNNKFMELANSIVNAARIALERGEALPKDLDYLDFFVADRDDMSIQWFGSIEFNGVLYKIGIPAP